MYKATLASSSSSLISLHVSEISKIHLSVQERRKPMMKNHHKKILLDRYLNCRPPAWQAMMKPTSRLSPYFIFSRFHLISFDLDEDTVDRPVSL